MASQSPCLAPADDLGRVLPPLHCGGRRDGDSLWRRGLQLELFHSANRRRQLLPTLPTQPYQFPCPGRSQAQTGLFGMLTGSVSGVPCCWGLLTRAGSGWEAVPFG